MTPTDIGYKSLQRSIFNAILCSRMTLIGVILLVLLEVGAGVVLPPGVNLCRFEDHDCLEQSFNKILSQYYGGIEELDLDSLDPLKLDKLEIYGNLNSPIKLTLNFTESFLYGIRNVKALGVKGFGHDVKETHEIHFKAPTLGIVGTYKLQGRFLILPIAGSGKGNLTLIDPIWSLKFLGKPIEKDGEVHLKIKRMKITFDAFGLQLKLDNLFNGDNVLGENMNRVLNENWREIYSEVKKPVTKAFHGAFTKTIQKVFDAVPYNKLFKP